MTTPSTITAACYLIISTVLYAQGITVCFYCAIAQLCLFCYVLFRSFKYIKTSWISFLAAYISVAYSYYAERYLLDLPLCSIELTTNKLSCEYLEIYGYSFKALSFIGFNFLLLLILIESIYLKKEDANHP